PWIAACHGRAVEGAVELVLVQLQPPPQRPAGAAPPRTPLLALDHSGRLAEHVRTLPCLPVHHRQRLERKACFCTGPADPRVTLERGERPIRRAPARHARTATNQRAAWTIPAPPSSSARPSVVKYRLYTSQREPSLSTRSWS